MTLNKATLLMMILALVGSIYTGFSQDSDYLKSNVAITGIEVISKSKGTDYFEVRLTDFDGSQSLPKGFGLNGYTFTDNGKYNDRVPNDGIYSSKETISPSQVPARRSSTDIYFDETFFSHKAAIKSGANMKGVGCEFEACGCPCGEFTCLACEWWGWSCIKITKCEFIIDIRI